MRVIEDAPDVLAGASDAADLTRAEEIRLRYAAIVESSDDAIIAKTLDGVISAWNPAAERMFGYTEREAIGQPITMIIPPDLHEDEHEILRRLRAGERIDHYETVRVTRAGECLDVSLTISPLRDSRWHDYRVLQDRSRHHEGQAGWGRPAAKRATAHTRSRRRQDAPVD